MRFGRISFACGNRTVDAYRRFAKEYAVKEYYLNRFKWIFNYTSNNFLYIIAKTLCIIVGLPIYCVVFALEMVLTFVNMLFCWIPILSVVMTVICKGTILIIDKLYYICILTDIGKYRDVCIAEPDVATGKVRQHADYVVRDDEGDATTDAAASDNLIGEQANVTENNDNGEDKTNDNNQGEK